MSSQFPFKSPNFDNKQHRMEPLEKITNSPSQGTYPVVGMTCAACAVSLESYLGSQIGVEKVVVSYPNQSVFVEYHNDLIQELDLARAAKEIGYELLIDDAQGGSEGAALRASQHLSTLKTKLAIATICTTPIFVMSMFFMNKIPHEGLIQCLLALPVILFSGRDFYINAYKKLRHKQSNMDTLVALSTATAFIYSTYQTAIQYLLAEHNHANHPHFYFESATVIITLILLGKYLEERAKQRSSAAIKDLLSMQPTHATVVRNNEEIDIPTTDILLGDFVIIKPGERIPIDGKVRSGNSHIDESAITGEPIPAAKTKGSQVFAGSINQEGTLKIIAQKVGSQTLLSQIVARVEQALGSKPQIQQLADRISSIFVPTVVILAIASALFWTLFPLNSPAAFALTTFINVLIIACPCALGLATPTALTVGIGKGAKQGILVKDAQALELASKLTDIVFDKTGTLTQGKPAVEALHTFPNDDIAETDILQILFTLEKQSEHPLAQAVINHLYTKNIAPTAINHFTNLPGKGITAELLGSTYKLGSWDWISAELAPECSPEHRAIAKDLLNQAQTVIALCSASQCLAILGIADPIKDNAKTTVSDLQQQGYKVHLLTGDNPQTAQKIATALGIEAIVSQALPNTKLDYIKQLQSNNRTVAMVGDGINDAQALAQADVSFAMGTGSALAMESAGVTLTGGQISQISQAISLSKQTLKTIHMNLIWAFGYNVLAIPMAMGIFLPFGGPTLNPMIAGAAMSFSSISVVLNSLWLSKRK
jgi:Cu2+-exporting ATPase